MLNFIKIPQNVLTIKVVDTAQKIKFSIKGALSGLKQFLVTESPLKNVFYFISKAVFILKIFKFLF